MPDLLISGGTGILVEKAQHVVDVVSGEDSLGGSLFEEGASLGPMDPARVVFEVPFEKCWFFRITSPFELEIIESSPEISRGFTFGEGEEECSNSTWISGVGDGRGFDVLETTASFSSGVGRGIVGDDPPDRVWVSFGHCSFESLRCATLPSFSCQVAFWELGEEPIEGGDVISFDGPLIGELFESNHRFFEVVFIGIVCDEGTIGLFGVFDGKVTMARARTSGEEKEGEKVEEFRPHWG